MEECAGWPLTSGAGGAGGRGYRWKLCDCSRWRNCNSLTSQVGHGRQEGRRMTAQGGGRVTTLASTRRITTSRLNGAVGVRGGLGGLEACNL